MDAHKTDLKDLSREELEQFLVRDGKVRFRAEQIFRWIHGQDVCDFDAMTNLAKGFREELKKRAIVTRLEPIAEERAEDGTTKYLFQLADGAKVEAVWIPGVDEGELEDATSRAQAGGPLPASRGREKGPLERALETESYRVTLCISTQAGCAMACAFCHTGTMKLVRNLTAAEIVEQVLAVQRLHPERKITNLVYMGMGEPLHNLDNVLRSIKIVLDPFGMKLSHKRVTVSTVGLVPEMERLSKEVPVNLAVSLHAATDELRDRIAPINKKYPLRELIDAVKKYPMPRKKVVMFEYVVLGGVNDRPEDIEALDELLRGLPCKINLIPFNEWPGSEFKRPTDESVKVFRDALVARGFFAYVRQTRGRKILAACGQLATDTRKPKRGALPVTP